MMTASPKTKSKVKANALTAFQGPAKPRPVTAADIMSRNLLTVSPAEKLADALQLMVENHVTGLPVVDGKDCCLGVISATDILTYEQDHADEAEEVNEDRTRYFDPELGKWESLRASNFALEHFGHVPVSEVMNTRVISVHGHAPVDDVARLMVEQEIHRVIVVDRTRHLLGTVSAIDIVRLVADGTFSN